MADPTPAGGSVRWEPLTVTTGLDALRVCARLQREHGIWIDLVNVARDGREVLTVDHERDILCEYGADALVRYYAPNDPRLSPLDPPRGPA